MQHYKYLLVGGGMTADSAARGIRSLDSEGSIGLISAESDPPYNRPPLTKGLWKGRPIEKIFRNTARLGVELHLGRAVTGIDVPAKAVRDDQGETYGYEKLLLATGGTPRRLPFGGDAIIYLRTLASYRRLRSLADQKGHLAVISAGFVGSEIAASLTMNGCQVTMIFRGTHIGEDLFPADLAAYVSDYYREKGVDLRPDSTLTDAEPRGQGLALHMQAADGSESGLMVDGAVAGLGIVPDLALARAAGLAVDDGILVDASLQTSEPDIYAAGDVASFYSYVLDKRMRIEHEDAANSMGLAAGQAMAGEDVQYTHLPFFYSDLFDLGYEAVGEVDSSLDTFADWQDPMRKGVIYYLRENFLRGVLLWNTWEQVDTARALLAESGPFTPADLRGRIASA